MAAAAAAAAAHRDRFSERGHLRTGAGQLEPTGSSSRRAVRESADRSPWNGRPTHYLMSHRPKRPAS
jgi:hypothetical protein